MRIEFDPATSEKNARERWLPFGRVEDFIWETASVGEDVRFDYPERRFGVRFCGGEAARPLLHADRGWDPGDQFSQGQQA
jgi:uncharacterized DUF497 family protein